MTDLSSSPLPAATRRAIAAGVAVLAILTVLGTAPQPGSSAAGDDLALTPMVPMTVESGAVGQGGQTFAQLFDEMRAPEVGGEGQGTVVVAAPPSIPEVQPESQPQPVATGAAAPALAAVQPVAPTMTVTGLDPATASSLAALEGVEAASVVEVGELTLAVPGAEQTVTVAAVEPETFRPLTPPITANETAVWERIIAGDAAFNHDAGNRLAVPLGSSVQTGSSAGALRIGAYASNGIPPVADALVSADRARQLGFTGEPVVYVALAPGADGSAVREAVAAAGGVVEEIEEPVEQQAFLTGSAAADFFEPFNYIDHGDGLITIDPDWVARNIETRRLPIFTGNVTCHRQMLIQLEGALAEVEAAGLAPLIDTSDYGGCWVARHIDWRPDRPISMHGWGLAVDFNVQTNMLGAQPTMDPRIVEIFDRWGFVWGGRWSRPDGMHFELGAVLQGPTGGTQQ
ncbi:M15 family metallopeptidase [Euzebya rosea]|uniref:M15 family metallopeptidase n=1 Tax=Euzebya rosea TaxID=2052804 RepID=UPI000D3E895A|nr:M15 family metallopeptidase [Euzebya rosea]